MTLHFDKQWHSNCSLSCKGTCSALTCNRHIVASQNVVSSTVKQTSLDATPSIDMPLPHGQRTVSRRSRGKVHFSSPSNDLDLWLWVPTNMTNICDKFHWNPSTNYWDITSREISVNGQTENPQTQCLSPPVVGDRGIKTPLLPWHTNARLSSCLLKIFSHDL